MNSVHRADSSRGALLAEAIVSLAILGLVLAFGAGFFARRRDMERDRLDHEVALRALASEWVFLRTAPAGEVAARERILFVGPGAFVDGLDARTPELTVKGTEVPGLFFVRLSIGYGLRTKHRAVQEGWVYRGGGGG
jgi:hypothetical protein